jgi:hypothetical protein
VLTLAADLAVVNFLTGEKITKLSDYLRAEQPDPTEPPSFYIPGAQSWHGRKRNKVLPAPDLINEDVLLDPLEAEIMKADELEAAEAEASALRNLEE